MAKDDGLGALTGATKRASHSKLSPSSAPRWMNCSGSIKLIAQCPESETTVHAAEGTVAHDLAEQRVTNKISKAQLVDKIGETVMEDGFEIEITEEMVEGVLLYAKTIDDDSNAIIREKRGGTIHLKAEKRVVVSSVDKELNGTADYTLYQKGSKLIVYDLKYGKGVVVGVKGNKQLMIYLLGAMDTFAGEVFESIEIVVIQPRAPHVDGPIRRWHVPAEAIKEFREKLKAAVIATREKNPSFKAGSHCRWCPAKQHALCDEINNEVQKQMNMDFSVIPTESTPTKGLSAENKKIIKQRDKTLLDSKIEMLSIEKLSEIMRYESLVKDWLSAVKERVQRELEAGRRVVGYKLVWGRTNRRWISEKQVISHFEAVLPEEQLYEKTIISPAKLEKLIGKGKLDALTEKPEPPKSIAKESDPREAIKCSAEEDFTPIEAEVIEGEEDAPSGLLEGL